MRGDGAQRRCRFEARAAVAPDARAVPRRTTRSGPKRPLADRPFAAEQEPRDTDSEVRRRLLRNDRGTLIAGCGGFPIVAHAATLSRLLLWGLGCSKEKRSATAARLVGGRPVARA